MARVVAGSYDRFLFGYQCSTFGSVEEAGLDRAFVYPAHKAPVKCIASSAPYLASGGADDLVHIYDLQAGTDLGFLMNPGEGAVSAVAFYAPDASHYPTHLLSGAADGGITVWQAGGEWVCLKTLRGHKKEVSSIALHPSGRLALSTARDGGLRLWNLVRGKAAHAAVLPSPSDQVAFSPTGDAYALTCGTEVLVHEVGRDEPQARLPHGRRPHCLAFAGPHLLLSGSEAGALQLWDLRAPAAAASALPRAHASRVRGACPLPGPQAGEGPGLVASAASDGTVRLWDWRAASANGDAGQPLAEAETKARLTCLTVLDPAAATKRASLPKPAAAASKAKEGAADRQLGKKAAAQKQKGPPPQQPQQPQQKRRQEAAAEGVAHDGVVEFPDAPDAKKGKKGKRRKQGCGAGQAAAAGSKPGKAASGKKAERVGIAKAGVQKRGQTGQAGSQAGSKARKLAGKAAGKPGKAAREQRS